jgi:predicted GNAT family acetyltransferase
MNAALGEQLLNIAMTEIEAEVQPHGVADDLGRKAMATLQRGVEVHRAILPARGAA